MVNCELNRQVNETLGDENRELNEKVQPHPDSQSRWETPNEKTLLSTKKAQGPCSYFLKI